MSSLIFSTFLWVVALVVLAAERRLCATSTASGSRSRSWSCLMLTRWILLIGSLLGSLAFESAVRLFLFSVLEEGEVGE